MPISAGLSLYTRHFRHVTLIYSGRDLLYPSTYYSFDGFSVGFGVRASVLSSELSSSFLRRLVNTQQHLLLFLCCPSLSIVPSCQVTLLRWLTLSTRKLFSSTADVDSSLNVRPLGGAMSVTVRDPSIPLIVYPQRLR